MEITIAFSYPIKFKIGAKIISLFMNKPYSHVLIYWKSKSLNRVLVYQASHGNVHFIELNNFLKENKIIKEFKLEITETQYTQLIKQAIDLAGEPYDLKGVLLLGYYKILNKIGISIDIKESKGYFCSELLANLCLSLFNKEFNKHTSLIEPSDIDDYLTTYYNE